MQMESACRQEFAQIDVATRPMSQTQSHHESTGLTVIFHEARMVTKDLRYRVVVTVDSYHLRQQAQQNSVHTPTTPQFPHWHIPCTSLNETMVSKGTSKNKGE